MTNKKFRVAAIVPAYNEAKTIAGVVKPLLETQEIDEVIVVSDGSSDGTEDIAKKQGAKVYSPKARLGKGGAMKFGVEHTKAEVILFVDADLLHLSSKHTRQMLEPVLNEEAVMCVGLRDRWGPWMDILPKLDPLSVIGGERAIKREIFEAISIKHLKGFMIESSLNYYCKRHKLPVRYVKLRGLDMVIKEKKMGFWRGLKARIKMSWQVVKIRFALVFGKKD